VIKRYLFLILTNILVTASLMILGTLVLSALGIELGSYGQIFVMSFAIGMGGSFASLFLSKFLAKSSMGLKEVARGSELEQKVHTLARRVGLTKMPEVYIFESSDMNAFATGSGRNNSLVAVSTGLMAGMNEEEVEGVLAHEVSHIASGDMVTMTLVQGVANAFAVFLSFVITNIIMNALRGDDDDAPSGLGQGFMGYFIRNFIYGIVSFLALPLVMYVSRWREFRADAGAATLVGKEKMISALERLKQHGEPSGKQDKSIEVMGINSGSSFNHLFASHPPLEKRVQALR
jgi:heat shock protein HtpX